MSCTLSVSSNRRQRSSRSRSSSVAGLASPDSTSSDSHSSSDPDTQLSLLSPWLQTPNVANPKAAFGMDIDAVSNSHAMDLDSEMSFDSAIHDLQALNSFQGGNLSFDDIVLSNAPSTKSDMLTLEEIIKDGAFDPAPPTIPPFSSYPSISPASRDYFIPPLTSILQESQPPSQPRDVYINPSSTQAQSQPPLPIVEQSTVSEILSPICTAEFTDAPAGSLTPPTESVERTSLKHEPCVDSRQFPPYDAAPFISISSNVVYPPRDACLDLPIFFPSIPLAGTKSRVETQIKLSFELCIPVSQSSSFSFPSSASQGRSPDTSSSRQSSSPSGSNSPSASPPLVSKDLPVAHDKPQQVIYDKVGTYKFLLLPQGTTTKRRSATSGKREPKCDPQTTLQMTADVVCCTPPNALVQSCASCQSREAKRTARKVAARVRPPPSARPKPKTKSTSKKSTKKAKDQELEIDLEEDVDVEEPNVDGSILQFNCAELVNFSGGSAVLPLRITCYCRHHKEKIGFNIAFTLRDYMGRIVGRGNTPPILITDDHKSTNVMSKLPPMHPLRQAISRYTPPTVALSPTGSADEPTNPPDQTDRAPTKRHDVDTAVKKRRPKPYDGRPTNRTVGVGPGIEGRQGVVLALHPAHARLQASSQGATMVSGPSTEGCASPPSRPSSVSATRPPTPVYHDASLASSSVTGMFTQQDDGSVSTIGAGTSASSASPKPVFQSTIASSSSSSSSISQELHALSHPQMLLDHQPYSQEQQPIYNAESYPIYPSVPFSSNPLPPPKIHRLIPSSGPTTGGIEITVLGSNFHASIPLECVFGGAVASSTHRWSDNTLVCVLPPRATPGLVGVEFKNMKLDGGQDDGGSCLFTYVDESDRQLMELALQVVGLKMTGKIEEARNVAMRIVGNTSTQSPAMTAGELTQMNTLSGTSFVHHSFLGSLSGMDLETLVIKLLTLLDVPMDDGSRSISSLRAIEHRNATGQTLLHLAVLLALPSLVSCLIGRSIDIDARNNSGLTALHLAALTGWKEGTHILIAEGADVDVVDSMGLTPAQRAKNGQFEELETLLRVRLPAVLPESESGDDGDDEARNSDDDESEYGASDKPPSPSWSIPSPYLPRSRIASSSELEYSSDEHSEPGFTQEKPGPQPQVAQFDAPAANLDETLNEKSDEKQDGSFVERLQRTLPYGFIPNVQMPGFPQLQLPDMLMAPWGALPQIPVFPVFVPIPNLPHLPNWPAFPWPDALTSDKKENRADDGTAGEKQQPSLAMLWTAYDSLANNAWRAQWEKWTAQVTALQNADNRRGELPPYSPRREEKQTNPELPNSIPVSEDGPLPATPGIAVTEETPGTSTSRLPRSKASQRVVYSSVKVSETEVDSYHYPAKKQVKKQDRMLVLFWIPILFLGLAYAVYTTLPVAFAGLSRAARRMLPQPLQRGHV